MVETIRVLVPKAEAHVPQVTGHVRALQEQGRSVLFVTADRPYLVLDDAFRKGGVDADRVQFLDVVSAMDGKAPAVRPPNAQFLQSPTMLEMMAMRIEQMASRMGATRVVVDSLNTLALYNGLPPVQEFSHYLANRLRSRGLGGDFVVRDNQEGRLLQERIASFTDEHLDLGGPA